MHTGTMFLASLAALASFTARFVAAEPSAGCGKTATLTGGPYSLNVNGKARQYFVKLPDQYDNTRPYALIFTLHARGGDAQGIVNGGDTSRGGTLPYYGLPPLSNNSAIFISPNGLNQGWANQGGEDTAFLNSLMDTIEADLCVEQDLRFSTGFSWGGAMSYSLACSNPDKMRAVAVLSGGLLSGCDGGSGPVAYYAQHGTGDSVLNVSMGRQLRDKFVTNNKCTPASPEPAPGAGGASVKTEYQNCTPGYPVTWVIFNGDHNPSQTDPGSSTPFAPANTWEFFSQFM